MAPTHHQGMRARLRDVGWMARKNWPTRSADASLGSRDEGTRQSIHHGIQRRPGGTDGGGRRPGHRLCAAGLRATRWCNWLTRLAHRMTNTATPSPQAAVHGSDIEGAQTRSEEHTSELQSLMRNSYAVFYL